MSKEESLSTEIAKLFLMFLTIIIGPFVVGLFLWLTFNLLLQPYFHFATIPYPACLGIGLVMGYLKARPSK